MVDASVEALDPHLVKLRGRSPLVLVPIANPANAQAMVSVANALAPPEVGRVLLLSVVASPEPWSPGEVPKPLAEAQAVLREALTASAGLGFFPEALTTVAPLPWPEISRVSRIHRCESLLLGFANLTERAIATHLEELMGTVNCDVVVLRAPQDWRLSNVRRILVPLGGRSSQNELRARLLGSLCRTGGREVTFLHVLPEDTPQEECHRARQRLWRLGRDEIFFPFGVEVIRSHSAAEVVARQASESDLVILGLQRLGRRSKVFGEVALHVAKETSCAMIMISRRG